MSDEHPDPVLPENAEPKVPTRERLIEAAQSMMADGGEQAVSLVGAATMVGVSRSTAHHHFRTRADLVKAVREDPKRMAGRYTGGPLPKMTPDENVARVASLDTAVARTLAFEILEGRDGPGANFEQIRASLIQRQAEGLLRPNVDIEMGALHLLAWNIFPPAMISSMALPLEEEQHLMHRLGVDFVHALSRSFFDWSENSEVQDFIARTKRNDPAQWGSSLDRAARDIEPHSSPPDEVIRDDADARPGQKPPSDSTGNKNAAGRETRRRLIESALTLMSEGGVAAVSLSKAAALIPVARTTAHSHFRTRGQLIEAAHKELWQDLPEPVYGELNLDLFDPNNTVDEFAQVDERLLRIWSYDLLEGDVLTHPQFHSVVRRIKVFSRDDRFYPNADLPIAALLGLTQGLIMPVLAARLGRTVGEAQDVKIRFAQEAARIWATSYVDYNRHPDIRQWLNDRGMV